MRCNGFKRAKNAFGQTKMQRLSGLQFSRSEVLDRQYSSCSNKMSYKCHQSRTVLLWDSSFSWILFLTTLCCHKISWQRQLRGFIPGVALNWINLVAATTHKCPELNFLRYESCVVFFLINMVCLDFTHLPDTNCLWFPFTCSLSLHRYTSVHACRHKLLLLEICTLVFSEHLWCILDLSSLLSHEPAAKIKMKTAAWWQWSYWRLLLIDQVCQAGICPKCPGVTIHKEAFIYVSLPIMEQPFSKNIC